MSENKKQLNKDVRNVRIKKLPGLDRELLNIDRVSELGFSDNSPFRNASRLDIHTPNGIIDMSNTGIPLLANGVFLPPYSGKYKFPTDKVTEERIPAKRQLELSDKEIEHYKRLGYQVEVLDEDTSLIDGLARYLD